MTKKQKAGCLVALAQTVVILPIWLYLLYRILQAVEATNVMWLLYWLYIPAHLFAAVLRAIWEHEE